MREGPISLGDVIRAMADLEVGDAPTRDRVRMLLGFEPLGVGATQGPIPPPPTEPWLRPPRPEVQDAARADPAPDPQQPSARGRKVASALERLPDAPPPEHGAMAPPQPVARAHARPAVQHPPLLAPRSTRPLLSAALVTPDAFGPVNFVRLVDGLVRLEPVTALPRHRSWTVRRGVDVLCDVGESMAPFSEDQHQVVEQLYRVLGRTLVKVTPFTGTPLRALQRSADDPSPLWRLPAPRTTMLLLSDLGASRYLGPDRAGTAEWLEFCRLARGRASPLVALVPYPPRRWPHWAASRIALCQWDRDATVGAMLRAVRQKAGEARS